jgi:hypothetical protein
VSSENYRSHYKTGVGDMKRISFRELRKQKWYQYLRYAYLGAFVISLILTMSDSISILKPRLDEKQSYIQCDNGQTYQLSNHGMALTETHILSTKNDRIARRLCTSDESIGELARSTVTNLPDKNLSNAELGQAIKEGNSFYYQNIYRLLAPKDLNYKVVPVYVKHSIFTMILWLVAPVLILVAIFELELRIFYYITLGRFLPERPQRYLFFKVRY